MTDPDHSSPPADRREAPRAAGFLHVMGAVFSGFLGIRRRASGERDMVTIKPVHVIVAGLIGVAIFVTVLVFLVTMITRNA